MSDKQCRDSQRGHGVIDVAPSTRVQILFLKVSTDVGTLYENRKVVASKKKKKKHTPRKAI